MRCLILCVAVANGLQLALRSRHPLSTRGDSVFARAESTIPSVLPAIAIQHDVHHVLGHTTAPLTRQ